MDSGSAADLFPQDRGLHRLLWGITAIVFLWSGFRPHDTFTWFLEVLPIVVATPVLLSLYGRFQFSRLACWLLCLHAIVLMVGGHYTYAEVPLFNAIRDHFHLARNHYDRLGHFMQGFVPAILAREILIRRQVVLVRWWRPALILAICLSISASYELFEWLAAVATGTKADAFLGTQGDLWDTQWDMAMAAIGALTAMPLLYHLHDRELARAGGSAA